MGLKKMDGEYWYKYIKERKPSLLGTDIIEYVDNLIDENKSLKKKLSASEFGYTVCPICKKDYLTRKSHGGYCSRKCWETKY